MTILKNWFLNCIKNGYFIKLSTLASKAFTAPKSDGEPTTNSLLISISAKLKTGISKPVILGIELTKRKLLFGNNLL